jgi:hypothetical protein
MIAKSMAMWVKSLHDRFRSKVIDESNGSASIMVAIRCEGCSRAKLVMMPPLDFTKFHAGLDFYTCPDCKDLK